MRTFKHHQKPNYSKTSRLLDFISRQTFLVSIGKPRYDAVFCFKILSPSTRVIARFDCTSDLNVALFKLESLARVAQRARAKASRSFNHPEAPTATEFELPPTCQTTLREAVLPILLHPCCDRREVPSSTLHSGLADKTQGTYVFNAFTPVHDQFSLMNSFFHLNGGKIFVKSTFPESFSSMGREMTELSSPKKHRVVDRRRRRSIRLARQNRDCLY